MEHANRPSALSSTTGPGTAPQPQDEPSNATLVLCSPAAAGYGRHAAPRSAYGPADVHRLFPVPPPAPLVVLAEDGPSADGDAGARSSDEVPARTTGFLARLRLLPRAA